MEAVKRTRHEAKSYSEHRHYRKRSKTASEKGTRHAAVNALIFDNGGYSIKIGYNTDQKPVNLPNCIMKVKSERKRVFVADQIDDCRDLSGLFYIYPHEKGYITKFDIQKNIWDYAFSKYSINNNVVMLTQPIFNFPTIQEFTDEVFFEEYDVQHLYKANATDYAYYNYVKEFKLPETPCIVVDSGFSFTHIVPYINGKKYPQAIIRMDVGGKLLTNYLKDIVSYRQLHVMEETHVINQVKEDVCYMAQNFKTEMHKAKTTSDIIKHYVMPDFHNIRRGYVHDAPTSELAENYQILRLNNERITIPEVMMRPSIITGFTFAGVAECIGLAISRCPKRFQKGLSANVVLCGGNSLFPGFRDRLQLETRMFLPCDNELNIYQPPDALNYAWLGGKALSKDPSLKKLCVSQEEYEEEGSSRLHAKFNQYCKLREESPKKEPGASEAFSYLSYWKNEGVDIFQKGPILPVKDPDIQFKLEGENIEEYDGKYVTLDFEIEKPADDEERVEEEGGEEEEEEQPEIERSVVDEDEAKDVSRQVVVVTSAPTTPTTLASFSSQLLSAVQVAKSRQIVTLASQQILQATAATSRPSVLNSNIILPKLTRIQPRIIRPAICSPTQPATSVSSPPKVAQFISLGSSVNLSDALIVSSSSATATDATVKTVVAPSILSNAVVVPQNMLASKNLTFQIIPIKPDMVRQGNIILTPTKTTKE